MNYPSRCLVFLLALVGLAGLVRSANAATLSFSPASGSYPVGQTFVVTLRLNSSDQAINASEGTVTWSGSTLQLVSVSASGSIFKYWPVDPVARGQASLIYSGGLPSPGYQGSAGTVLRITFQAKAVGASTVQISAGKILANDGLGTNVYSGQSAVTYTISAAAKPTPAPEVPNRPTPVATSSTHPDQTGWYRDAEVKLTWARPNGLRGVSYTVTADQSTTPDDTFDSASGAAAVTLPSDGIWYFHLRGKYDSGWSATNHYALHLDRTPPLDFTPQVKQDRGPGDPTPELIFVTTDSLSGVAKYTYTVDGGPAVEAASPVDLADAGAGTHTIVVTAYDQAGNVREEIVQLVMVGYTAPTITSVSTPLLLLDPLVVRGTANSGDTITVYVNGQAVGQVVVGPSDASAAPGVNLRLPWGFTTEKIFRPGTFNVTATATSADGQVSVATDPRQVRVNGQALTLNGRPIATFSVVTPLAVLVLSLLLTVLAVMARLVVAVWMMHRRTATAAEELEMLRDVNRQQSISRVQLDQALVQIEEDLDGDKPARRPPSRRRSAKRTR